MMKDEKMMDGDRQDAKMPSIVNGGDDVATSEQCDVEESFEVTTEFLVAADGTARTVANEMGKNDKA